MMENLNEFDVSTDKWSRFLKKVENYFVTSNITEVVKKRATLLNLLSEDTYILLYNLTSPNNPESMSYEDLIKLMTDYFKPQGSVFTFRFKFYTSLRMDYENPDEWSSRVRNMAKPCNFDPRDYESACRDQFIVGFGEGPVQERLFLETNRLTFLEAVNIATNTVNQEKSYEEALPTRTRYRSRKSKISYALNKRRNLCRK